MFGGGDSARPCLQQRTSLGRVEELRQRVEEVWDGLDRRVIDTAVREWRRRLRACIAADEGHFEHALLRLPSVL